MKVTLPELRKLCLLAPTQAEIATFFGCSQRTVERTLQRPEYREAYESGFNDRRMSPRRAQFHLATVTRNVAMCIWLGKQELGQREPRDDAGFTDEPLPWIDD